MASCGAPEPAARSLLLITIDTWRGDAFGAGGDPSTRTPQIDRFFRQSVQFSRAFAPVPTTLASHTSLLTGAWPTRHGVPANLWPVPEDVTTLAEILSAKGFETAAFVSSVVLHESYGLDQGFDVYNFKVIATAELEQPWRPAPMTLRRAFLWWDRKEDPRFLWVHLWEPHAPYEPAPVFARLGDPGYEGPASGSMDYLMDTWDGGAERMDPEDVAHVEALYRAEIEGLDRVLGRFLDAVHAEGQMVVLTSDHGESLGEHGLFFKHGTHVYPADLHVPLAIRAPGVPPGLTGALVRTIDVPRTVLRRLRVDDRGLPEEGEDLLQWSPEDPGAVTFGVASQPEQRMAHDRYPCAPLQQTIRTPRWTRVETPYERTGDWFDSARDPGELDAVPGPGGAVADSLRGALHGWIGEGTFRPGYGPSGAEELREQVRSLGYID